MQVQRIQIADPQTGQPCPSFVLLDDAAVIIPPINAFLRDKVQRRQALNSIRAACQDLKIYWTFLQTHHLDWQTLRPSELATFWASLQPPALEPLANPSPAGAAAAPDGAAPRSYKAATCRRIYATVCSFHAFHAQLSTGRVAPMTVPFWSAHADPASAVPWFSRTPRGGPQWVVPAPVERPALTREQVAQLHGWCYSLRDQLLISLLFIAGLRLGEARGLRHGDIDLVKRQIWIIPRQNSNGAEIKGRVPEAIPVPRELLDLYRAYLRCEVLRISPDSAGAQAPQRMQDPSDYVLVNLRRGKIGAPLQQWTIEALFLRLGTRLGQHIYPHLGRHHLASYLVALNVPLPRVQRLLRHRQLATTLHYVHAGDVDTLGDFWDVNDPYLQVAHKVLAALE